LGKGKSSVKWERKNAVLDRISQKGITKEVTFEQRLEGSKGTSLVKTWGKSIPESGQHT
jgi:hypothetical protein